MSEKKDEPLRGEAAFKAEKKRISDNNEAAFARARTERAARDAERLDKERAAERRERDELPIQPTQL